MTNPKPLPRYFLIDGEIPVKVDKNENDQVFGINAIGNPYPPLKAVAIGEEINQDEFNRLSKAFAASS